MARFQVYRMRQGEMLAVDLQADMLSNLPSRVMAPLYRVQDMPWAMARLNPRFNIDGDAYVMATQRMASLPLVDVGPVIAYLSSRADDITAALDFLFQGF
jgi:toxin CcdB